MSKEWLNELDSEEFSEFYKGSLELARKTALEVFEPTVTVGYFG